jgi:hypothetical protein
MSELTSEAFSAPTSVKGKLSFSRDFASPRLGVPLSAKSGHCGGYFHKHRYEQADLYFPWQTTLNGHWDRPKSKDSHIIPTLLNIRAQIWILHDAESEPQRKLLAEVHMSLTVAKINQVRENRRVCR